MEYSRQGRDTNYIWKYIFDISGSINIFFPISVVNIVYYMPFISFRTSGSIWITAGTIQERNFPNTYHLIDLRMF